MLKSTQVFTSPLFIAPDISLVAIYKIDGFRFYSPSPTPKPG